jgi:hypothetical protein
MSEIKRYHIGSPKEGMFGCIVSNMFEDPKGEWVRWEDVAEILADLNDCRQALKHLTEPQLKIGSMDWLDYWGPRFSPHSAVSEEAQKK